MKTIDLSLPFLDFYIALTKTTYTLLQDRNVNPIDFLVF